MYPLQKCLQQTFLNEFFVKITKIYSEKILTVGNAVHFRLSINLMHITPPVTAQGFDGSYHPRYAECFLIHKFFNVVKTTYFVVFLDYTTYWTTSVISLVEHDLLLDTDNFGPCCRV